MKNSEAAVESLPENFGSGNEDFEKRLMKMAFLEFALIKLFPLDLELSKKEIHHRCFTRYFLAISDHRIYTQLNMDALTH